MPKSVLQLYRHLDPPFKSFCCRGGFRIEVKSHVLADFGGVPIRAAESHGNKDTMERRIFVDGNNAVREPSN